MIVLPIVTEFFARSYSPPQVLHRITLISEFSALSSLEFSASQLKEALGYALWLCELLGDTDSGRKGILRVFHFICEAKNSGDLSA
eukprot:4343989-Pleurochrysis_carterae.AAC.2